MDATIHSYSSRIYSIIFWWFHLLACYFILGSFYAGLSSWYKNILGNLLGFLFFFVWGLIFLFFANMFPEITSDQNGLLVRFFLWRIRINWQDIVGLTDVSLFGFLGNRRYVVKTKNISFFHRFYGLYALSFAPSFFVKSDIKDFSLLLERVQGRKFKI